MSKFVKALSICVALLFAAPAFAVDGVVLINQATVTAAGGFPYKITQPGSYRLSGNLMVTGTTDGIDITVGGVTLDLNGFKITGPVTCSGQGSTLSCSSSTANGVSGPAVDATGSCISSAGTTVRNGTIEGFGDGVVLLCGGLVEEVQASGNDAIGIRANDAVVRRNIASYNRLDGIRSGDSTVIENVADENHDNGLVILGGLFGSNSFESNGAGAVQTLGGEISQNNNNCSGTVC